MFQKAKPIFLKGLAREMNITGVFTCDLPATKEKAVLRVTGATRFRVYLNGEMLHYGPARAAHGYFRVDEVELNLVSGGQLRIDAASYNVKGFDGVDHPGFVLAEVEAGGRVLAATGYDFAAFRNLSRLQRTMRYAFQRQFSEVYAGIDNLLPCEAEIMEADYTLIPREAPMPCMDCVKAESIAARGTFVEGTHKKSDLGCIENAPDKVQGFGRKDLEAVPYDVAAALVCTPTEAQARPFEAAEIAGGEYVLYDFGRVYTGFMTMEIEVMEEAELIVSYEDLCPEPFVTNVRLHNQYVNVVAWTLKPGRYALENFDPFEMRYMQFNVMRGSIRVDAVGMRQYIYPACEHDRVNTGDAELDMIYDAAVATFRQNSVDVYLDCPTRERGGWLCDSYYTAKAEYTFTGDNRLERVFLKNFVDCGQRPELPEGMIPMNYPGEVMGGQFIPQWSMWYILELEEALERCPQMDKEGFRKLCYGLIGFYARYLNEDGMLESMPGWNFVEWSRCNDWVDGVNYPTNFLYSRVLKAVGTMYGDEALIEQCARVREATIARAFDGEFFTDNALRDENGALVNTGNTSETGQYYAIHFGELDLKEKRFDALRNAFENVFGPDHEKYAVLGRDIEPSTPFIGIYLRMECLLEYGLKEKLLDEIKGFFGDMARVTGTLWEHANAYTGSLNHGFAAYAATAMVECLA